MVNTTLQRKQYEGKECGTLALPRSSASPSRPAPFSCQTMGAWAIVGAGCNCGDISAIRPWGLAVTAFTTFWTAECQESIVFMVVRGRRGSKTPFRKTDPEPKGRVRIFLSYRRDDTAAYALLLYESLRAHFGDNVFMDIETLSPGLDFVDAINETLDQCGVMLAVIGRAWLSVTDAAGRRRLDNPEDLVRLEIEAALARDVRVVPVLVGKAVMPGSQELPGELKRLARRHAFELSDVRWRTDAQALIDAIDRPAVPEQRGRLMPQTGIQAVSTGFKPQPTPEVSVVASSPEGEPAHDLVDEPPRIPGVTATISGRSSVVAHEGGAGQEPLLEALESPSADSDMPMGTSRGDEESGTPLRNGELALSVEAPVEAPERQTTQLSAKSQPHEDDLDGPPQQRIFPTARASRRRLVALLSSVAGLGVIVAVLILELGSGGGPPIKQRTTQTTQPIQPTTPTTQPLGVDVSGEPSAIAITPTGTTAFVTDFSGSVVVPIDLASFQTRSPITVGKGPTAIAMNPNGATAYVADFSVNAVTPIDLASGTAGSPISLPTVAAGNGPTAIAINHDGTTAYVLDGGTGTVTPIDLASGTAGSPIIVGDEPGAIAITPDGTTAYVVDPGADLVTPVDLASGTPGLSIAVGHFPEAIAITPDGTTAYVANTKGNTVTPINLASGHAGSTIAVGKGPTAIAITPDGTTAYVANGVDGTVTPIEVASGTPRSPIAAGSSPTEIAITPNGTTAYVVNGFIGVSRIPLKAGR